MILVSGYTGQDGTFLTDLLLREHHEVLGMTRRISTEPPARVRGSFSFQPQIDSGQLRLVSGDLCDLRSLMQIFKNYKIDEVYNLAAQSDVRVSFDQPIQTFQQNAVGVLNLITAMELYAPEAKLYQASTSEMYGTIGGIQNEETPFAPASPYGEAKLAAYWMVRNYRNKGKFACNGILFNHESEIRGAAFVTQKIIKNLVHGTPFTLGNLEASRDWGYAGDYVEAMYMMMQHETPGDYVVATGKTTSVRKFAEMAASAMGIDITWHGQGVKEVGVIDGETMITIDPKLYRPVEVDHLRGDASKAKETFGWEPKTSLKQMIYKMANAAIN